MLQNMLTNIHVISNPCNTKRLHRKIKWKAELGQDMLLVKLLNRVFRNSRPIR